MLFDTCADQAMTALLGALTVYMLPTIVASQVQVTEIFDLVLLQTDRPHFSA